MRFGTVLPERGPLARPEQLSAIARHAEDLGFYALEFGDHIVIPRRIDSKYPYTDTGVVPSWDEWSEQLTSLTFIAARTSRIRLITSVLVLPYRTPLLAAKMLANLDVLSNGRLIVGVGAGWMKEEFEALQTPKFEERGRVSDECIEILREVWTKENPQFSGKYFSFNDIKFSPKPVQKPHPPIWVGGESPAAMRRAARLGNGWYPIGGNPRFPLKTLIQLQEAVSRLRGYSQQAGKKYVELEIGFISTQYGLEKETKSDVLFVGDSEKIISDIRACERLGVSYISFDFLDERLDRTIAKMDRFSVEVMSRLRQIGEAPSKVAP